MVRYSYINRIFAVLLAVIVCVYIFSQNVWADEKYERKSISILNRVLITPGAKTIPDDRVAEIITNIKKQIKMPRFDYNDVPAQYENQFWQESEIRFEQPMKKLEAIDVQFRHTSMSKERESELMKERQAEEEILFKEAETLLTETVARSIANILMDPEVLEMRAKKLVSEAEHQKFIMEKAKTLGISSTELEKVMNSAYLCMVAITDYSTERDGVNLTYNLSGRLIWFKLIVSDNKSQVELLKRVQVSASSAGNPNETSIVRVNTGKEIVPFFRKAFRKIGLDIELPEAGLQAKGLPTKVDGDTAIFNQAAKDLVREMELETRKIEDFQLKNLVLETGGSKVGFAMGKSEGLYVGQKFRVSEKEELVDQVKIRKRGFFYVTKIGDNISDNAAMSYGKMVIRGAQPGMTISELQEKGVVLGGRFKYGQINFKQGYINAPNSLRIKEDVNAPVKAINLITNYDLGKATRIPLLFTTIGGGVGLVSNDGILIEPYNKNPTTLYYDIHIGLMKKIYIRRIALYVEPLIQYQMLSMSSADSFDNKVAFNNSIFSFSPNVGMEFAIRENMNFGIAYGFMMPIPISDKWSKDKWIGSFTAGGGKKVNLFNGKAITGPEVAYPKLFSTYMTFSF